jgi:peptide/nickel transport system permease protein
LVRHLCDEVVVMYAKQVVETGPIVEVFGSPQHPYTEALLDAVPTGVAQRLRSIEGQAPPPASALPGCNFAPRCGFARDLCSTSDPHLTDRGGRWARCWGTEREGWVAS